MFKLSRLDNGLTVATAAMPHMASVSLGLWVAVGGRYEPAEVSGACHFIEHMLFKGTRRRSARQISQDVEGIGGYLNAFTSEESTCFYSRARHDRLADLLEVLVDMFLNSRFAPAEVAKERAVIKEEIAMYLDQPQQHVHELLHELLWPGQPLGRALTGTPRTLDSLGRRELIAFQQANYVTGRVLIAAAGRVRHEQLLASVRRVAGRFPRGHVPSFKPADAAQSGPRLRLFTKETEQTQLALALRTCSRHDPRRYALRLLNTILGENMSSRLFQVVREDRGLAYSIYSALNYFDDVGTLVISAGLDTDNLPGTLKLILRELRRLVESPVSAAEFRRARDYVIGQFDLSLESTENQMMWLGEQWAGYRKLTPPAEVKRRLAEATPADVRAVARDFFQSDRLNLALVSPLKREAPLRRWLRL
jgi:predicted Zn-dependent peptidase